MQTITIGRLDTNDVTLTDMSVSREHAQIIRFDDGTYSITDLNSLNGTYVNGQRINGTATLNENDSVRIGETTLPWKEYFKESNVSGKAQAGENASQPTSQKKGTNVFAILGFIFAFVASPLGLIFSILGLALSKKFGGKQKGLAIAGLIISIVGIIIWVVLYATVWGVASAFDGFESFGY